MEGNKQKDENSVWRKEIRLDIIFSLIWKNRRRYIVPVFLTALVTALLSLCVPRYYDVQVKLAPEYSDAAGSLSGGLGSLASSFGINMNSLSSQDAITPTFYPDLLQSTDFLVPLLYVNVCTADSSFTGRYIDYITKEQSVPWWTKALGTVKRMLSSKTEKLNTDENYKINPFRMSKVENDVIKLLGGNISCTVDKKTDIITIVTRSQDPLVTAMIADSVTQRLQDFIIGYRTNKARTDLSRIQTLCDKAQKDYIETQHRYSSFVDSHNDLILQSYKVKETSLENELQLAYNVYSGLLQQKQLAEAKLLERTPSFTTVQNAFVPVKHSGPKRMLITIFMAFMAFVVCSVRFVLQEQSTSEEKK